MSQHLTIYNWATISNARAAAGNGLLLPFAGSGRPAPDELYRLLQCSYPKFFKMDDLCKWAWLAAECVLAGADGPLYAGDGSRMGIVLATADGCLGTDKRFAASTPPSPALFVYTLPNIMLGELCIRHGYKGSQLCMVSENFDAAELHFAAQHFLLHEGMDACLCGWVNVTDTNVDAALFLIDKNGGKAGFTPQAMDSIYARR